MLLVVKILGSQKLYVEIQVCQGFCIPNPYVVQGSILVVVEVVKVVRS